VRKRIAASILVGSLLFGGISVGAAEVSSTPSKTELNDKVKTQTEINKERLQALFVEIKQIKNRVQNVLAEVKPLQSSIKELITKLKVAKEKKDKVQIKTLKDNIAKKQQTVKKKLDSIQPDIKRLKELQTELKEIQAQLKPQLEPKKVKSAQLKYVKLETYSTTKLQAKEGKQQGDVEKAKEELTEVSGLAEQIIALDKEIQEQKLLIRELLAK
jgi:chromosome segregation ATPase